MRPARSSLLPLALVLGLAGPAGPAAAQQVDDPGRLLASNCFQCHGTDGRGARGGFEAIEARELVEELREMARSSNYGGEKGIMRVHAQGYSAGELGLIADYLARACGTGCGAGDDTPVEPVEVALRIPNTRLGDVRADNPALDCTARCDEVEARLPPGSSLVLTAVPQPGRRFARWTGGCRSTDPVCEMTLDGATRVTAWFARR